MCQRGEGVTEFGMVVVYMGVEICPRAPPSSTSFLSGGACVSVCVGAGVGVGGGGWRVVGWK
jgi:hypothetical protein